MAEGIVIGNLTIPVIKGDKGDKGDTGEIISISLVLLSPSSTAYAINNGSTTQAQIELGIPKGLSVSTTNINASGELVFTFNDNSTVNVGKVVGKGISEVTVTEEYDFVVTYTDGTSVTACNLEEEILGAINDILESYYTKTEIDEMGFITKEVNNLTNYYKKDETYTKQEVDNKLASVYKYKGTVATYADLPSLNLTIGDVYNVESDGSNYAWNGTTWDKLGGEVDLSGYQTKIDSSHKLNADLVDDTSTTHKFTSTSEKSTWNAKYDKPSGGIPKADLTSDVQTSLGKADTAIQNTDYASASTAGVIKGNNYYNVEVSQSSGTMTCSNNSYSTYQSKENGVFISKGTLENVITGKQLINQSTLESSQQQQDNIISDLKTKNELLVKDHVPIENTGTELQLTGTGDLPMELVPYGNISQETNLYNNDIVQGGISEGNDISATNRIKTNGYISVKAETSLPISFDGCDDWYVSFFDNSKNFVSGYGWQPKGNSVSIPANINYIRVAFRKSDNSDITPNSISNVQIGNIPNIDYESPVKVVNGEYEIYSSRSLPNEYQEVEYISSTSARTQYINLNRMTNKDNVTKFKIKTSIQWNSIISNAQYLGANGGSFLGIVNEKYSFGGASTNIDASTNEFDNIEFEINYNTRNIQYSVNGVQNQGTRTNAPIDYKISIFGIFNSSQEISFTCDCKIKYFIIYENDNVIFNLIPCYRKSDNTIGMYDLVNGVFYTNAGTGSFNKGQNQNTVYLDNPNNNIDIDTSSNPLYSENDCYKYLTSEQATALGLNTGEGWYVYNEWGIEIANGTTNKFLARHTKTNDKGFFTYSLNKSRAYSDGYINAIKSNYLKAVSSPQGAYQTFLDYDEGIWWEGNTDIIYCILPVTTLEEANAILTNLYNNQTPLYFIYKSRNATYTKITNTTLINSLNALLDMQSYYDITNISQTHGNNQADMRINAKALKSIKAMQSEIDELKQAVLNS